MTVAPKPEARRWIVQRNTHATRARHGIGLRRNLTNQALCRNVGQELQAHAEWQADLKRHREFRPDIDNGLPDIGARDRHHVLSGRDHLPDVGSNRDDHAGKFGLQLSVAKLLEGLCQVRLGARHRGFGAGSHLLGVVDRLPGGGIVDDQRRFLILVGARVRELGFRLGKVRLSRANGKLKRCGIEGSQNLPFDNRIANVHRPRDEPADNTEAQVGFEPRLDNSCGGCASQRLGSTTAESTGRTGSGTSASCLQPAMASVQASRAARA